MIAADTRPLTVIFWHVISRCRPVYRLEPAHPASCTASRSATRPARVRRARRGGRPAAPARAVPRRADDDIGVDPSSIDQARRIAVELVDRGNHLDQSIADGDEHLLVDDRGRTPEPDSAAEHALRGLRQARIGQIAKAQVADRIPSLGLFASITFGDDLRPHNTSADGSLRPG